MSATTDAPEARHVDLDAVLDELRLHPAWNAIVARGISQALAKRLAETLRVTLPNDALAALAGQIWHERAVTTTADLEAWMDARQLDEARVRSLVIGEAVRRWGEEQVAASTAPDFTDQLQLSDEYPTLLRRAARKRAALQARGLLHESKPIDLDYQQLLTWCVAHLPHIPLSTLGQSYYERDDAAKFMRAVIHEYHYVTRCSGPDSDQVDSVPARLQDSDIVCTAQRWP